MSAFTAEAVIAGAVVKVRIRIVIAGLGVGASGVASWIGPKNNFYGSLAISSIMSIILPNRVDQSVDV